MKSLPWGSSSRADARGPSPVLAGTGEAPLHDAGRLCSQRRAGEGVTRCATASGLRQHGNRSRGPHPAPARRRATGTCRCSGGARRWCAVTLPSSGWPPLRVRRRGGRGLRGAGRPPRLARLPLSGTDGPGAPVGRVPVIHASTHAWPGRTMSCADCHGRLGGCHLKSGTPIVSAAAPPTLSLPPAGILTSSQARWAYGCTVAAAKQTPQFPCLEDRCRHQGLERHHLRHRRVQRLRDGKETDSD